MKISFVKQYGGTLTPASDIEAERMKRFQTGEMYEVEIKLSRNPAFHGKVFKFFDFCFQHWRGNEYQDEPAQREEFRKNLTILAGYFDKVVTINGEVKVRAKSLSFVAMDQETFEKCYKAMVDAAMRTIFQGCGEDVEEKLLSFF